VEKRGRGWEQKAIKQNKTASITIPNDVCVCVCLCVLKVSKQFHKKKTDKHIYLLSHTCELELYTHIGVNLIRGPRCHRL